MDSEIKSLFLVHAVVLVIVVVEVLEGPVGTVVLVDEVVMLGR